MVTMQQLRRTAVLALSASLVGGCGSKHGEQVATTRPDSVASQKVWTPDQARAAREARERGEPTAAQVVAAPGPAVDEDSARWAAEEKVKYDQRVHSMSSYAACMAQAHAAGTEHVRPQLEAACARLRTAPP